MIVRSIRIYISYGQSTLSALQHAISPRMTFDPPERNAIISGAGKEGGPIIRLASNYVMSCVELFRGTRGLGPTLVKGSKGPKMRLVKGKDALPNAMRGIISRKEGGPGTRASKR